MFVRPDSPVLAADFADLERRVMAQMTEVMGIPDGQLGSPTGRLPTSPAVWYVGPDGKAKRHPKD